MRTLSLFPFALAIAAATLVSCGNRSNDEQTIDQAELSDKITYIRLDDADSILPEWSKDNVLVVQTVGEPDNLHPTNGATTSRSWVLQLTSNAILRTDLMRMEAAPDLAVALPEISANKLEYTYQLRKDARWDDGSPITAEDAVFTIMANACPLTANRAFKSFYSNVAKVITYPNDAYRFTVVMQREAMLNAIFLTDFSVMQRKFYDPQNVLAGYTAAQFNDPNFVPDAPLEKWANEFNDPKYGNDLALLNGCGPYEVVEWNRGSTMVLQRKKNHWTQNVKDPTEYQVAYPEKIVFKIITDPNAQKLELLAQTVDVSTWMGTQVVMELMQEPEFNKHYNVQFADNFSYNYIGLNMRPDGIQRKKIFDDVLVRRAMAYLIPVDELIQTLANGYAKRQASMISPLKPEYNTSLALIPFDVERAKQLLDSAGWKDTDGNNVRDKMINGVKTELRVEFKHQAGQKFVEDAALMIKEAAYRAGMDMVIVPVETNTLKEQLAKHDFDMYMSALASGSMPEDHSQLWHTSAFAEGGMNYVGFGSPETDALIDSINIAVDTATRHPLVRRLQQHVYDEQPFIFLYSTAKKVIIHKRFGNQIITFERPNVVVNNLRLLSQSGSSVRQDGGHR